MKIIKPDNYTNHKKLICDWTDENSYLVNYRLLKLYVRHGMVVEKIHKIISFRQSRWWENFINFKTQKKNLAEIAFEKNFYKLLKNAFYGKTIKNVRNRIRLDFFKKDDNDKVIE